MPGLIICFILVGLLQPTSGDVLVDGENEKQISANLRTLNITRISIAHRSEMAGGADLSLRFTGPDQAASRRRIPEMAVSETS